MMPIPRRLALLLVGRTSEAAHRDAEWLGIHLIEQSPSVSVREGYIGNEDVKIQRQSQVQGGRNVSCRVDLVSLLLEIPRQVAQRVFVILDQKDSQETWWTRLNKRLGKVSCKPEE